MRRAIIPFVIIGLFLAIVIFALAGIFNAFPSEWEWVALGLSVMSLITPVLFSRFAFPSLSVSLLVRDGDHNRQYLYLFVKNEPLGGLAGQFLIRSVAYECSFVISLVPPRRNSIQMVTPGWGSASSNREIRIDIKPSSVGEDSHIATLFRDEQVVSWIEHDDKHHNDLGFGNYSLTVTITEQGLINLKHKTFEVTVTGQGFSITG